MNQEYVFQMSLFFFTFRNNVLHVLHTCMQEVVTEEWNPWIKSLQSVLRLSNHHCRKQEGLAHLKRPRSERIQYTYFQCSKLNCTSKWNEALSKILKASALLQFVCHHRCISGRMSVSTVSRLAVKISLEQEELVVMVHIREGRAKASHEWIRLGQMRVLWRASEVVLHGLFILMMHHYFIVLLHNTNGRCPFLSLNLFNKKEQINLFLADDVKT